MKTAERERIQHTALLLYREQEGRCANCGKPLEGGTMQLAHRIPQRKWCLKKWGAAVIHHPQNLRLVCGLYCNAMVQVDPESLEASELADTIKAFGDSFRERCQEIEK